MRHRQGERNEEMWLETMLRLKLNCVELETTVTYPDYKQSAEAHLVSDMGLVLTSHHHVALNNSFARWDDYWREVRHEVPHKPNIHRLLDLIEFWRYNVETVHRSGIENLWQVTFRGRGDQPFWAFFDDAPESEEERGQVISQMMHTPSTPCRTSASRVSRGAPSAFRARTRWTRSSRTVHPRPPFRHRRQDKRNGTYY